jgi:hypothetical protein
MNGAPTAARRRLRVGLMTAVLVLAATVSLVIANVLAARASVRFDMTSNGEHALSPRTLAILSRLHDQHEIVIAGPLSDHSVIDVDARRRVEDVLSELKRRSEGRVAFTLIDTGSGAGLRAYQDLLARLAERDSAKAKQNADAVSAAADHADQLAAALDALSPKLQAVRDAIPEDATGAASNRAYFDQRAAECRLSARALKDLAGKARQALQTKLDPLPIADTESAADSLRPALAELQPGLAGIVDNLRKFVAAESLPAAPRDAARPLIDDVAKLRDAAGIARDSLDRLPRLEVSRVAAALRSASVALVIGPAGKGLTAVEFATLLPPPAPAGSTARPDYGRGAEELLGTALGALANPNRPIVVLLHAQTRAAMERLPFFDTLTARLAMHGIDVLLWAVAEDAQLPSTTRLDPSGLRPVVYACFNTAGFASGAPGQNGQDRVAKLTKALTSIVDAGKPLLMSILPSTAPSYGEKDPTTAFLPQFGLEADAGRPLLRERLTPEGRRVEAFEEVQAESGDHPILRAIRGLPTRLEWPIALHQVSPAPPKTSQSTLYKIDDAAVWGESQWLAFFQVPISQHASVPNPPSNDSPRDDPKGPWIVAAAAERSVAGIDKPQRLVVVGSNSWFTDPVLREAIVVDGRVAPANPGNAELFEASISWLAGQDDLIAQSATARAVPLIRPLSSTLLLVLKLAATVGLPVAVLLAGVVYRVWRG